MSMLAERRVKKKWTLNPGRQPLWKNDESTGVKFGKVLMEKMGWKAGQGLGVNEQGISVPLKIAVQTDSKGMGFKESENEWIQQQYEFNQLLTELTGENKSEAEESNIEQVFPTKSLEQKSKLSKARVHYYKFTRGKDLSRYTQKDLECILGRNNKDIMAIGEDKKPKCNVAEEESSLKIVSARSMVEYFEQKMKDKLRRGNGHVSEATQISLEEVEEENKEGDVEEVEESCDAEDQEKQRKKKKKKRHEEGLEGMGDCNSEDRVEEPWAADEHGNMVCWTKKKKKKNKKNKSMWEDAVEKWDEEECRKAGYAVQEVKKKKMKEKKDEDSVSGNEKDECLTRVEESQSGVNEDLDESSSKKKKKRKRSEEEKEIGQVVEASKINDNKKKRKKKKREEKWEDGEKEEVGEETGVKCVDENAVGPREVNAFEEDSLRDNESPPGKVPEQNSTVYKVSKRGVEKRRGGSFTNKVFNLIHCTNICEFNGSNLESIKGYGIVRT